MAFKVAKLGFWGKEIEDKPGALAKSLETIADAKVNLKFAFAYRNPAKPGIGLVWVHPIKGQKATKAAKSAGMSQPFVPVVLSVEGPDRPGLGYLMSNALGEAGINIAFVNAIVFGKRFISLFGFDSEADARKAMRILKTLKLPRR